MNVTPPPTDCLLSPPVSDHGSFARRAGRDSQADPGRKSSESGSRLLFVCKADRGGPPASFSAGGAAIPLRSVGRFRGQVEIGFELLRGASAGPDKSGVVSRPNRQ